ncbi:DUF927 domain-containing protein [uncultured Methanolobus sp.]|uniref:DUF927 domain-containing protein n=1 Tax=uncultured Methanolobus sp. TaxID=218300 RepID=UPI00374A3CCD
MSKENNVKKDSGTPSEDTDVQTLESKLKHATDQWKENPIHGTITVEDFTFTFRESPELHESLVSVKYNGDETGTHGFSYEVFKENDANKKAQASILKGKMESMYDISPRKANKLIVNAFNGFIDKHRNIIETKIRLHRKCVNINREIYTQAEKRKHGAEKTEFEGIPVTEPYCILGDGLYKTIKTKDGNDALIHIACACAIAGIGTDDKGKPAICLAWETDDGRVRKEYYPRWMVQDRSGLSEIRKKDGFSFIESNAYEVMKYLEDLINDEKKRPEDKRRMAHFAYTDRTGWHDEGFVYGHGTVGEKEYAIINPKSEYLPHLKKAGSIEGWVKGLKGLLQDKNTLFIFWGAYMSPLLSILGLRSIILNQSGGSGDGKTTAIAVAFSGIGHPEDLIYNGNTTPNAHEPYLASQRDMPTSMDETTILDDTLKKVIKYLIYMGKGKSRLGDWDFYTWLTVLLTTMETSIFSEDSEDGEIPRVINVTRTKQTRPPQADIDAFYEHVYPSEFDEKNYGHFIEPYITLIVEKQKTGELKTLFNQFKAQFRSTDKTQDRMSGHFAAICVSGYLCNEVFRRIGIPVAYTDPYPLVREMADDYFASAPEPKHIRALGDLLSEIDVNIMFMKNPKSQGGGDYSFTPERKIHGYEAGNYGLHNDEHLLSLSFVKSALKKFGWKWDDIKDIWKREGILITESQGYTTQRVVRDPDNNIKRPRCVVLNLKTIEKTTGIDMKEVPNFACKGSPIPDSRKPVISLPPIRDINGAKPTDDETVIETIHENKPEPTCDDMYIPFFDDPYPEPDEVLSHTSQVRYPSLPPVEKFEMN